MGAIDVEFHHSIENFPFHLSLPSMFNLLIYSLVFYVILIHDLFKIISIKVFNFFEYYVYLCIFIISPYFGLPLDTFPVVCLDRNFNISPENNILLFCTKQDSDDGSPSKDFSSSSVVDPDRQPSSDNSSTINDGVVIDASQHDVDSAVSQLPSAPGDVSDLANKSAALTSPSINNDSSESKPSTKSSSEILLLDPHLVNFVNTKLDELRICRALYDNLSNQFSKIKYVSSDFSHYTNKSRALFYNSVSASISFSYSI
jgi:hypothetical protein